MDKNIIGEYYQIIKSKISQANFDSAMDNIEKLIYNFPSDEYGYYYRGVCEFARGDYPDSIKSYSKALKLNPGFGKAYFNLGVSHYMLNDYDNALINIGKALIVFSKLKQLENKARCFDALNFIEIERSSF